MHVESNMPDHLHSGTKNDNEMQAEVFILEVMWVSHNITHCSANLL
jgi:hypothetical protein